MISVELYHTTWKLFLVMFNSNSMGIEANSKKQFLSGGGRNVQACIGMEGLERDGGKRETLL